jgi:uncharacterized protein involved in outer membrane biogenesis
MRKFILWFFGIAIVLVLGMITAYLLAKRFEEPVRNYIVKQVNTRLKAPVHVADINFSFLERFPSASLVMDDVWAEESIIKMGQPDTLFFFQKVYLNLDVFALFKGSYKINEIEVRRGFARLLIDEEGYDNYHIWQSTTDTTGFLLELDKVHLEDTRISFQNTLRHQWYDITADDLYFKGSFSEDNYTMAVFGDGIVHDLQIKGTSYLLDRRVHVETDLDIVAPDDRYAFRKGELTIDGQLDFSIAGVWVDENVDLRIQGKELDIIRTLSLIPIESRTVFDRFQSTGEFTFDCTLKGAFSRTSNPLLSASFSFKDARVSPRDAGWSLTGLVGKGRLTNGAQRNFQTTLIELDTLTGALNGDAFALAGSFENFDRPHLQGHVKVETDLEGIQELAQFEGIEAMSGSVNIDASLSATLEDPSNPKPEEFLNSEAIGSILLREAKLVRKGDDRTYEVDRAVFALDDNDLKIVSYQGHVNNCAVGLSGVAEGFLGYLFTNEGVLDVRGSVEAGDVNLNELFASSTDEGSGVVVAFPTRSSWSLDIEADAFAMDRFVAREISGKLIMNAFKVEASGLRFQSQEGSVNGSIGIYRFSRDQLGIRSDFQLEGIDIQQLFYSFKDFDQSFIPGSVLSGRLDAEVDFQAFCDSLLKIDTRSILSTADVRITDGAITGFQPLIDVASAIEEKKMLRLFIQTDELRKRLEDVRFATLENELTIRNGQLTIPQMIIQSTALNLNVSGTHSFENDIDYALDFALSDVLTLKERKGEYNAFVQEDEEGKTRVFLRIHGTTESFEVDLERTDIKRQVKEEIRTEKETVKGILKEEFGVFSKETDLEVKPIKEEVNPVGIEFDPSMEEDGQDPKQQQEKKPSDSTKAEPDKKPAGFMNKLIKKTESDKKKLKEGDFEDDDF